MELILRPPSLFPERPTWILDRVWHALDGSKWKAFYDAVNKRKMWELLNE